MPETISNTKKFIESSWKLEISKEGVQFIRLHNGNVIESYGIVPPEIASIYAVAIIHNFQPPRGLLSCDKPFDQTQSG